VRFKRCQNISRCTASFLYMIWICFRSKEWLQQEKDEIDWVSHSSITWFHWFYIHILVIDSVIYRYNFIFWTSIVWIYTIDLKVLSLEILNIGDALRRNQIQKYLYLPIHLPMKYHENMAYLYSEVIRQQWSSLMY